MIRQQSISCDKTGSGKLPNTGPKRHMCGAYVSKGHLERHIDTFHIEGAISHSDTEFAKHFNIVDDYPPMDSWVGKFSCGTCDAIYPNRVPIYNHTKRRNATRMPGNSDSKCDYCDAVVVKNKWLAHMTSFHSQENHLGKRMKSRLTSDKRNRIAIIADVGSLTLILSEIMGGGPM